MAFGNFGKKKAAPAAAKGKPAAKAPANAGKPAAGAKRKAAGDDDDAIWGDLNSGADRTPMLDAPAKDDGGTASYVCKVGQCQIKVHPHKKTKSFHAQVTVMAATEGSPTPEGATRNYMSLLFTEPGRNDMFRLIRSAAGYATDDEFYEAFGGAEGGKEFCKAVGGYETEYEGNPIEGRFVQIDVGRGNDVMGDDGNPSGDYFRNYRCSPVDEDDQEVARLP